MFPTFHVRPLLDEAKAIPNKDTVVVFVQLNLYFCRYEMGDEWF
jgi:hypothetical protein